LGWPLLFSIHLRIAILPKTLPKPWLKPIKKFPASYYLSCVQKDFPVAILVDMDVEEVLVVVVDLAEKILGQVAAVEVMVAAEEDMEVPPLVEADLLMEMILMVEDLLMDPEAITMLGRGQ